MLALIYSLLINSCYIFVLLCILCIYYSACDGPGGSIYSVYNFV